MALAVSKQGDAGVFPRAQIQKHASPVSHTWGGNTLVLHAVGFYGKDTQAAWEPVRALVSLWSESLATLDLKVHYNIQ